MSRPLVSIMAEQAVLGAALSFPGEMEEGFAHLQPDDFASREHRTLFGAVLDLIQAGKPTDPVAVADLLHARGEIEAVGMAYLAELLSAASLTLPSCRAHADSIAAHARLRRIHEAAIFILRDVEDPSVAADGLVDSAAQRLMDAAARGGETRMVTAAEVTREAWEDLRRSDDAPDGVLGATTGLRLVDWYTGGMQPGQLWVVAARPSVGKTAWAIQAMLAMARKGQASALVSLETPARKIMRRLWGNEAGVNLREPRDAVQSRLLGEAVQRVKDAPIRILDVTRAIGVVDLRAKIQAAHRAEPLAVVVIDYLGLMDHPRADRRDLAIGETTRALKIMAREFGVAIVMLHQLSRANEKERRPPVLSDLRDSGNIEQDVDVGIFLHLPDSADEENLEIRIAKNRDGPIGGIGVKADRGCGRFYQLAG